MSWQEIVIGTLCIMGAGAIPPLVCWFESWTRNHEDGPGAGLL